MTSEMVSKLALGSAQIGMPYGVSNDDVMTQVEIEELFTTAAELGVDLIDTAPVYGNAETLIGRYAHEHLQVVTKLPATKEGRPPSIKGVVKASLDALAHASLYGLLVHDADDLLGDDGEKLYAEMQLLKESGLTGKIGMSVYNAEQIDGVMTRFDIDLVQVPCNVLDQRLVKSGHLNRLKSAGVEVHARSVFLQGLLLMSPEQLDPYFESYADEIAGFFRYCHEREATPMQVALSYIFNLPEMDRVVIGVNSADQLRELVREINDLDSDGSPLSSMSALAADSPGLVDPGQWRLQA